jgi:hypothetical protein
MATKTKKSEKKERAAETANQSSSKEQFKKKPLLKFQLRRDAGPHFEKNLDFDPSEPEDEHNPRDVEFAPGETVGSRRRLDKVFPNKFRLMAGQAAPTQGAGGDIYDDPDEDPDKDRPVRSAEEALTRQRGRYLDESELEDGEDGPSKEELRKLAKGQRQTKAMEAYEKFGEDVTDDYPEAKDADFVVFEKNGKFTIADGDEPTKPLRKGLKAGKVKSAIQELQEE